MSRRQDAGRAAEAAGEDFLRARGYRVVARNFRTRLGELDRVAWHGETLCFVEVRFRAPGRRGTAIETVGATKRARLRRAAGAYLLRFGDEPPACRFDVIGVTGGGAEGFRFELVEDAFRDE